MNKTLRRFGIGFTALTLPVYAIMFQGFMTLGATPVAFLCVAAAAWSLYALGWFIVAEEGR